MRMVTEGAKQRDDENKDLNKFLGRTHTEQNHFVKVQIYN